MPYLYLFLSVVLIFIDQIVKHEIVEKVQLGEQISAIPNVFSITHLQNDGAAWSLFRGQMTFFYIVTALVMGFAIFYLFRIAKQDRLLSVAVSLVISGGVGNLIDRVRQGYVVDMIQVDFVNFPVFNVADMCLVIGVILILLSTFFEEKRGK